MHSLNTFQDTMPWNLIDGTDYQQYSVIILVKCSDSITGNLHYMTIIGRK
jgi:hypothetical protein